MDELSEQRRVGPGDALVCVLENLQRTAMVIRGNPVALLGWTESAVDLLACLPDMGQRVSWAIALAESVTVPIGGVMELLAGELLHRAQEVRRCRV